MIAWFDTICQSLMFPGEMNMMIYPTLHDQWKRQSTLQKFPCSPVASLNLSQSEREPSMKFGLYFDIQLDGLWVRNMHIPL